MFTTEIITEITTMSTMMDMEIGTTMMTIMDGDTMTITDMDTMTTTDGDMMTITDGDMMTITDGDTMATTETGATTGIMMVIMETGAIMMSITVITISMDQTTTTTMFTHMSE